MDERISRIRNGLQIDGKILTPDTTEVTIILADLSENVLMGSGATVPINGETGYAKGCMFIQTDGGIATTFYINEGDETTCDFNVNGGGSPTSFVALTDTPNNYSSAADKILKVNTGGTAVEFVTPSGVVAMDNAGVFSIVAGSLIDADIKSDAAIAWSKMASSDDIETDGTVSDLTITDETSGDVLYFDGSNWVALPATSLPAGTASVLAQITTIEAGTNDVVVTTTTQTVSAGALTIPDFAGVADTFVFITLQQTLANKILKDDSVQFGDNADLTKLLDFSLGGATTAKKMTILSSHTDNRVLTLPDATDNLVGAETQITLLNKLLSGDTVKFADTADATKLLSIALAGATTGKELTLLSSHTNDRTITLPDATDTLLGKATVDVLTNKSLDADGSGNVITNVNADELYPSALATAGYGIPVVIPVVNGGATNIDIFSGNAPFKFRIIDAWAVNTKAGNTGSWKLQDGGTVDITSAISYGGTDNAITRLAQLIDATHSITTSEELHIINSDGADTAIIYISVLREV